MLLQIVVATALFFTGTTAAAKPNLTGRIRDENRDTRAHALQDLRKRLVRGDADAETVEAFVLTGLETDHVLLMEAGVLVRLVQATAVPQLQRFLSDARAPVRARAADGLGAVGRAAATALVSLLDLLKNDNNDVAAAAGMAISRIDHAGEIFPDFLMMLRTSDRATRLRVLHSLDGFDSRVGPIVDELLPLVRSGDATERYWFVIVVANTKLTEPEVVRTLADMLRLDPSAFVRERCARELWELAAAQKSIPDYASDALAYAVGSDPEELVRAQARKALFSNQKLGISK